MYGCTKVIYTDSIDNPAIPRLPMLPRVLIGDIALLLLDDAASNDICTYWERVRVLRLVSSTFRTLAEHHVASTEAIQTQMFLYYSLPVFRYIRRFESMPIDPPAVTFEMMSAIHQLRCPHRTCVIPKNFLPKRKRTYHRRRCIHDTQWEEQVFELVYNEMIALRDDGLSIDDCTLDMTASGLIWHVGFTRNISSLRHAVTDWERSYHAAQTLEGVRTDDSHAARIHAGLRSDETLSDTEDLYDTHMDRSL
jgi:hypothetical protein